MYLLLAIFVSFWVGWLTCIMFTSGKIQDLETKIKDLEYELENYEFNL